MSTTTRQTDRPLSPARLSILPLLGFLQYSLFISFVLLVHCGIFSANSFFFVIFTVWLEASVGSSGVFSTTLSLIPFHHQFISFTFHSCSARNNPLFYHCKTSTHLSHWQCCHLFSTISTTPTTVSLIHHFSTITFTPFRHYSCSITVPLSLFHHCSSVIAVLPPAALFSISSPFGFPDIQSTYPLWSGPIPHLVFIHVSQR